MARELTREATYLENVAIAPLVADSTEIPYAEFAEGSVFVPTGSLITSLTWYGAERQASQPGSNLAKNTVSAADQNYLPAQDASGSAVVQTVGAGKAYPIPVPLLGYSALKATMASTWADSSGNGHNGVSSGSPAPDSITSPWSGFASAARFQGDGLNGTSGINIGTFGVSAAFCVECKFKLSALLPDASHVYVLTAKWNEITAGSNFAIFCYKPGNTVLAGEVTDGTGANKQVLGSTALVAGTTYDVCLDYDGTTLRLWLSTSGGLANLEASIAVASLQAPDATTITWIGRYDYAVSAFSLNGVIDEVRISSVSRHVAAYTPQSTPFTSDADTTALYHFDDVAPVVAVSLKG